MSIVRWERDRAVGLTDALAVDALDGDVLVLDGLTADDDDHLGWIRSAPCVVIAITPEGKESSAAVDVVLDGHDAGERLDPLLGSIAANPAASRMLVEVLRAMPGLDVPAGLTLESLAYSTLLAGPEFARWLEAAPSRDGKSFDGAPVRTERDANRLDVTLARPANRNAFSAAMRDALFEALTVAAIDDTVDEIVLSGDGPVFCSGGDLTEFGTARDVVRAHQVRVQRSVGALVSRLPTDVTAHVHGACVGAGVELPAFADRVVAYAGATFRLPEVTMGLIPGAGGTVSICRRIGRQATAELALSGQAIDAARALALGLVDAIE